MKRFFALLLCLALVLPLAASAEEEEEVSISELTGENLALDEEGNIIDGDDDPFDFPMTNWKCWPAWRPPAKP